MQDIWEAESAGIDIWLCFHICPLVTLSSTASIQRPSEDLAQTEASIFTATNRHNWVADAQL